ncbi:hypothetical protein HNQ96_005500 [Aminobacter lissarensis]|uniref:Uncharacterized protein n=1 Tax=Aminobacter carboxidus TaxID=376165 RepID=A0A8E1WLF0_9HYPH|nr:hypothetical protein [Aminobacter lissarensis]MBB6469610.1 hypothetical protein [Aminobacter lissarensis]
MALISIEVPADRIDEAISNPDALQIAYDVGVLELLSIGIAMLGLGLVILSLFAYLTLRRAAQSSAREVAMAEVPAAVDRHIRDDGFAVIKQVLKDPQALATLQAEWEKLGLTNASEADLVEGSLMEAFNERPR